LTYVSLPGSVTSIAYDTFAFCSGLTNVIFGNGLTSIGEEAFDFCTSLSSVTIPASVTSIGGDAFVECYGLTSVTIGKGVTSIASTAFAVCSSLTSACFQGNAPSAFGSGVFAATASDFSIYYPSTASGWSTPTWNGYPAHPYPLLSLRLSSGAVTPSFNYLLPGTNYQLQVSTDLSTWSNPGPVFTATNANQAYPQPFDVSTSDRLFFRLALAP
jgi:hypothetical protein